MVHRQEPLGKELLPLRPTLLLLITVRPLAFQQASREEHPEKVYMLSQVIVRPRRWKKRIRTSYNLIRNANDCIESFQQAGASSMSKKSSRKDSSRKQGGPSGYSVVCHEDDFTRFVKENWQTLGLTPVFIRLLVQNKGWWPEMVDDCFRELVGEDYADIKMTEWVRRLEDKGYDFPDGKPVFVILNEILIEAWGGHTDDIMPYHVSGLN
jgi:hypothetical protein